MSTKPDISLGWYLFIEDSSACLSLLGAMHRVFDYSLLVKCFVHVRSIPVVGLDKNISAYAHNVIAKRSLG